jgi:hypothetical protein
VALSAALFLRRATFLECASSFLSTSISPSICLKFSTSPQRIISVGTPTWALIERIVNSVLSALTYSRLEAGKSILPDFATSLGVIWPTSGVAPTKLGVAYLALDTLFEAKWTLETLSKISQQKPVDPCQDVKDTTRQEPIKCTPEQNEKLKKELSAFEEP